MIVMSYWRKDTGAEEFIEIIDYLVEKKKDYYSYSNYPSPMSFIRYPILQKGWNTQLKDMKRESKEYAELYAKDDMVAQQSMYESTLINKLNRYASYNISWKDGKSAQERFRNAKDMIYYFKKEAAFE